MQSVALAIAGTEDTPEIKFTPENNTLFISGRSLPEDVTEFYKPVFEWLNEFSAGNPGGTTVFVFKLEYFNTASSKIILDILMQLEELSSSNKASVQVEWHYSEADDDMMEAGEEYKDLVDVPFKMVIY